MDLRYTTALVVAACCCSAAAQDINLSAEAQAARNYPFSPDENRLLDEVQRGCFDYLWNEVGQPAGLVRDRLTADVSSVAAVGFQLSALPIGVERGWVSRRDAEQRAKTILRSLIDERENKKYGIYLHFVDQDSAQLKTDAPEVQTSTVDHALLQSGAIPAAVYFGGEVRALVDRLISDANWQAYGREGDQLLTFGWRSQSSQTLNADGKLVKWVWHIAGAEEALCYLHAVGAPNPQHALDARVAYQLKRKLGRHDALPPYVVTWNGAMFTYFFDHCWIDYRRYQADDPSKFGGQGPRVHWFENTRRAFVTHRQRCIEKSPELLTLGRNRWGLGPCMGLNDKQQPGYLVPESVPNHSGNDRWHNGTVAPYVTAAALPFMPKETLAALREMKNLKDKQGRPLVWRSPTEGGYGFLDSFNLEQDYAPEDYIGINVGPMLLLIENARSGLVWDLFHQHPHVRRAVERLGWQER